MTVKTHYFFPEKQDNLHLGAIRAQQDRQTATLEDFHRHMTEFFEIRLPKNPVHRRDAAILAQHASILSSDEIEQTPELQYTVSLFEQFQKSQTPDGQEPWAAKTMLLYIDRESLIPDHMDVLLRFDEAFKGDPMTGPEPL